LKRGDAVAAACSVGLTGAEGEGHLHQNKTLCGGGQVDIKGFWPVAGAGAFGGLIVELYRWWLVRESGAFPAYARTTFYWVVTITMVLAGAIITVLYGYRSQNAILAVNIGASAPALVSAFTKPPPPHNSAAPHPKQSNAGPASAVQSNAPSIRNLLSMRF